MKQSRINGNEFMVVFDDHDERGRYLEKHHFKYRPTNLEPARWVAENNGGDKSRLVILTPFDDPRAVLVMRARLVRKEARGVFTNA